MKVVHKNEVAPTPNATLGCAAIGTVFRHPSGTDVYVKVSQHDGVAGYFSTYLHNRILALNLNNNTLYWYEPRKLIIPVIVEVVHHGDL